MTTGNPIPAADEAASAGPRATTSQVTGIPKPESNCLDSCSSRTDRPSANAFSIIFIKTSIHVTLFFYATTPYELNQFSFHKNAGEKPLASALAQGARAEALHKTLSLWKNKSFLAALLQHYSFSSDPAIFI